MGKRLLALALFLLSFPLAAWGDWPYMIEEASTMREGSWSFSAGVSRTVQRTIFQRGGDGTLWTLPELDATLGIGDWAEVSAHFEMLKFERDDDDELLYENGDLTLWTKLKVLPSKIEGLSLRFGVKLPNADQDENLGTDETDFWGFLLYDFTLGPLEFSVNGGVGILGHPAHNNVQTDLFSVGFSAIVPVGAYFRFGLELRDERGHFRGADEPDSPWGGESGVRQFTTVGAVAQYELGSYELSLGVRRGFEEAEGWGAIAGITYYRP